MSGIGHNSEAEIIRSINSSVDQLIKSEEKFEKLQEKLDKNKDEEQEPILLELGSQLLKGRKQLESDEHFSEWLNDNFPNLSFTINEHERAAVIWAAEYPEDYLDIKDRYSRVRTIRGRHSKWKEEQKANQKDDTDDDSVADEGKGDKDSKPSSGSSSSGQSGNTGSDKPSGGNSDDKNKPKKPKPVNNPDYCIAEGMGAIKGIAELYSREYGGTPEDAADVLFSQTVKGCEQDSIGMSIARDRVKWFLKLKEVMDLAEPKMHDFLNQESKLQVVK